IRPGATWFNIHRWIMPFRAVPWLEDGFDYPCYGGGEMHDGGEAGLRPGEGNSPQGGPFWEVPDRDGAAEALSSMGTIAAPLLGGFSLAAMVQTLTLKPTEVRWSDAALLLFLLAAMLFIAAVQAMFWARGYQVTPPEISAWWPDAKDHMRLSMLRA